MRELRLIGVHDDGEHLLLTEDGDDRLTVPIDDALRSALKQAKAAPSADPESVPVPEELRPRDIQALLRAGVSVSDVAERAGWTTEKVERYAGPIRAEREHIAELARAIVVSGGAAGRTDTTFGERAERRLDGRGVEADDVVWDSWRGRDGTWTVLCSFPAGGRQRRATWHFDVRSRTLEPTDDEARWLGEDEGSAGPLSAGSAADASVYDVEAEGGLNASHSATVRRVRGGRTSATAVPQQPAASKSAASKSAASKSPGSKSAASKSPGSKSSRGTESADPAERPVDLVAAMRERSKNRRRKGKAAAPHDFPEDAAPREKIDTSGEAPPVGSHPREHERTDAEDATEESAEHLDHDPVTGTADLFADLAGDEQGAEEAADEGEQAADEGGEQAADETSEESDAEVDSEKAPAEHTGTVIPDRPSSARKGRPSVPSWDDIMFGRRPGRD